MKVGLPLGGFGVAVIPGPPEGAKGWGGGEPPSHAHQSAGSMASPPSGVLRALSTAGSMLFFKVFTLPSRKTNWAESGSCGLPKLSGVVRMPRAGSRQLAGRPQGLYSPHTSPARMVLARPSVTVAVFLRFSPPRTRTLAA